MPGAPDSVIMRGAEIRTGGTLMPQQATIADSRVEMTELVMPQEINPLG